MSVLLSNTEKPGMGVGVPERHIDPAVDLDRLAVCFGGFSPTAMGANAPRLREAVEVVERRLAERRAANERAAAVEAARASEEREWVDADGIAWRYVVLDDAQVRIERCGLSKNDAADVAVLDIPARIDGKPVVALAADCCCDIGSVERITIPDTVVSVGYCAFRNCSRLKEIAFPAELASFDTGWVRNCSRLERLKLPGKLDKITPSLFDVPTLKVLSIGGGVAEVMPGAFAKSRLERIEVSPDNQFLSTDGTALYSKDKSVLVALAVPVDSYEVVGECVAIARKGFSTFGGLQEVALPEGLELVGDFAFTRTGIRRFDAPPALTSIGERAFFACAGLEHVALNRGLVSIGSNAFTDTAIRELCVPATVVDLGNPIVAGTALTFSGKDASFRIATPEAAPDGSQENGSEGSRENAVGFLSLDEFGGLYRHEADGLHLVRMLEPNAVAYELAAGTVAIDDGAFAKHASIEKVILPEGLTRIGKGAFRDARKLVEADFPDTLEVVDDEAFLDTNITRMRIPARLTRIGAIALITEGSHHGTKEPALRHIAVDSANPRFSMQSGLLIEQMGAGVKRVVLCTGEEPDVVVPEDVTVIASYAFNGVRRLRTLTISEKVTAVDVRGLAFDCLLENIHIDLAQPYEGREFFEFEFPNTPRAAQQMGHAFGSPNFINVEGIFNHYDIAIVNRSGFDAAEGSVQFSAYEQAKRIVARLLDPVYMTSTNRGMMESTLTSHLNEICVDVARHDDKGVIDGLLDLGYINEDNITDVINAVGTVQDASITNYLLDQKRRRFGAATIDFEL